MRTVVITGASSGIGKATAEMFVCKNAKVYDLSRHSGDTIGAVHIDTDVTDPASLEKATAEILEKEGSIDVLVCCAGMGVSGAVEFIAEGDMKRQFDVNLYGTINTVKAVLPSMRKNKAGRIICVSSVAAMYAIPFQAYYSASKAAINSFTDALRNEVKPFNISVCAVMPGDIATGFTDARQKTAAGSDVYKLAVSAVEKMEKDERGGMKPSDVAALIVKLSEKKKVAPLYTVGLSYKALVFIKRLFPNSFASMIIGGMYK